MPKKSEKKAVEEIIDKMFDIAGYTITYKDIENRTDFWFNEYTMTDSQYDEWLLWGEKYLQKNLKMTKKRAQGEIAVIGLNFGLKIDNLREERDNKINNLLKD